MHALKLHLAVLLVCISLEYQNGRNTGHVDAIAGCISAAKHTSSSGEALTVLGCHGERALLASLLILKR